MSIIIKKLKLKIKKKKFLKKNRKWVAAGWAAIPLGVAWPPLEVVGGIIFIF
jgi:hypothetical protein